MVLKLSSNFCNRCDLVITPTEVVKRIVEPNVQTKVQALPTGIDTSEFSFVDRQWLRTELRIPQEKKILLHLGRLGKEKNVVFLLQAYNQIRKSQPNTVLVIVGDGPEREALQTQAQEMGLAPHVIFTGSMPREAVINCYAGADIFVFASTTETQGLVLGEAKAAGLPSVAVKALGASEMVNHGVDGFLTDLAVDEFSKRVLQLLENEELLRRMSANCLVTVQEISSTNMAKKLLAAYEELLENKCCSHVG